MKTVLKIKIGVLALAMGTIVSCKDKDTVEPTTTTDYDINSSEGDADSIYVVQDSTIIDTATTVIQP
ncbi:hypothetical protein ACRASX_09715 [Flavobacterium sp. TMP13]|uniref:hypothetical protein n=1 Tax=Flavobacterium sp. TMP13 TaxID=3425950 RepID=UPI003D785BC0